MSIAFTAQIKEVRGFLSEAGDKQASVKFIVVNEINEQIDIVNALNSMQRPETLVTVTVMDQLEVDDVLKKNEK